MCSVVMTVLLLQLLISQCASAPLLLQPSRQGQQGQQLLHLQQLQQLEALQRIAWPQHLTIPPIIILIQNAQTRTTADTTGAQTKRDATKKNANKGIVDKDLDSVIIEADPEDEETRSQNVLLLPSSARLSIGDVISAIPFLPIEINVPDTIGWVYNGIASGISSIISIFGRQPVAQGNSGGAQQTRLRTEPLLQTGGAQLLLLPLPQLIPIHLPIQV
ncbi:PREDICTED: uncharacterized protein LOC106100146 [Papilio polytes]|uniref:uncharacterized protein LOC106100146 n=1 Tax=Papilio polytes TaxID=76194 RepID=UPI000675D0E3|nr:PREDICTED: uncharacterized protein LOC106100146 [Papilio polytes]